MKTLFVLQNAKLIDVYFADESGFSLTPNVPYGWQPKGKQLPIDTQKKHVTNIFGLLDPKVPKVFPYATKKGQMVNTEFMVQCIEDFIPRCKKPTVIILDNAPWHTSESFKLKRKEWMKKDLFIFYLPKYSPHLNLIETLWRKMKYEWIRPKDYNSKTALKRRIKEIFDNFGTQFSINFSMNVYLES